MTLLRSELYFGELYVFPQVLFSRENFYSIPSNDFACQAFLKFIFKFHFAETLKALWLLFSQDSLIIIALAILDVKLFLNFLYLLFSAKIKGIKKPRDVLSSQAVAHQVLSALKDFTSVFGM